MFEDVVELIPCFKMISSPRMNTIYDHEATIIGVPDVVVTE